MLRDLCQDFFMFFALLCFAFVQNGNTKSRFSLCPWTFCELKCCTASPCNVALALLVFFFVGEAVKRSIVYWLSEFHRYIRMNGANEPTKLINDEYCVRIDKGLWFIWDSKTCHLFYLSLNNGSSSFLFEINYWIDYNFYRI